MVHRSGYRREHGDIEIDLGDKLGYISGLFWDMKTQEGTRGDTG